MKTVKGSVSVVLALTVTLILSFCMILVESARENTMLLKSDAVFNTGIQCLMAEYHKLLWEDFDLMYVDASYGMTYPEYERMKAHLYDYIDHNLSFGNDGWLALEYIGAQVYKVVLATDAGGKDFFEQATEAAKEAVGISYIEQILYWLKQTEATGYMESVIAEEMEMVSGQIENVNGTQVEVKEAVWGTDKNGKPIILEEAEYQTVDIENPLNNISYDGSFLVRQVLGEAGCVPGCRIEIQSLGSERRLATGDGMDETESAGSENALEELKEKAFFCKYLLDHFATYTDVCYGKADELEGILQYPLEYIIGGSSSDMENLEKVMGQLLLIREVDNYLYLLQDEVRTIEAEVIGDSIAAAAAVPWLGPVVTQALLLFWAYEDSISDLKQLFQGERIPLIKAIKMTDGIEFALNYEQYLVLLLMFIQKDRLIWRSMDMIEMMVRTEQANFRMDGCISRATFSGIFRDRYGKQYMVSDKLQYFE